MTIPTPATLFANRRGPVAPPPAPAPRIVAQIQAADPGKVVTLGLVDTVVETAHDGVVKTKNLLPGQRVRAFIRGEARGGERIVKNVTKVDDGAVWHVEFASAHPDQDYKAAYRWYDESLVGTTVQHVVKSPGFVAKHA